jgi:hypothetical protein
MSNAAVFAVSFRRDIQNTLTVLMTGAISRLRTAHHELAREEPGTRRRAQRTAVPAETALRAVDVASRRASTTP